VAFERQLRAHAGRSEETQHLLEADIPPPNGWPLSRNVLRHRLEKSKSVDYCNCPAASCAVFAMSPSRHCCASAPQTLRPQKHEDKNPRDRRNRVESFGLQSFKSSVDAGDLLEHIQRRGTRAPEARY